VPLTDERISQDVIDTSLLAIGGAVICISVEVSFSSSSKNNNPARFCETNAVSYVTQTSHFVNQML